MEKPKIPRHKLDEMRRKEDEMKTKEVYKEFVETFQDSKSSSNSAKTFVRGEVVNADSADKSTVKPRLYKPSPSVVLQKQENPLDAARRTAEEKAKKLMEEAAAKMRPQKPGKKKDEKPRSNLEAFKEELRRLQEEREDRRKFRRHVQESLGVEGAELDKMAPSLDNPYLGGTYDSDPLTTNLFMSNLNPKSTEEDVHRIFGRFGPLASVKIMWPRTDEERNRGYLTGFVAFMTRKDADRAAAYLRVKLNWGKPIPIPHYPVYVPPRMLEMTLPPPPSGLPFNAQPKKEDRQAYEERWQLPGPGAPPIVEPEKLESWEKMIRNAVIKVVIPTERPLLCMIHRLIEFVVREGPIFEAMVMNKEISNPLFRFLFDNQCPAHVYYRWKLYSILQGDGPTKWRTEEFRMFENGSLWRPPPVNFFHQGLPIELYDEVEEKKSEKSPRGSSKDGSSSSSSDSDEDQHHRRRNRNRRQKHSRSRSRSPKSPRRGDIKRDRGRKSDDEEEQADKGEFVAPLPVSTTKKPTAMVGKKSILTDSQRRKLSEMLKNLTPERQCIGEAMLYCVEHAEAAEEIVAMIEEGIGDPEATLTRKIAKLYLIADILANCAAKVMNVSYYRKFFHNRLESIFRHLHDDYARIDARLKAEQIKTRVMACCRVWEETAVYATDFLIKLQNIFLGLIVVDRGGDRGGEADTEPKRNEPSGDDLDGEELAEEDIEGVPMDEEEGEETTGETSKPLVDYDLDGMPLEEEEDGQNAGGGKASSKSASAKPSFFKSKWETVDPEVVKDQALTLSKWEKLEQEAGKSTSGVSTMGSSKGKSDLGGGGDYDDDLDGEPMDDDSHEKTSTKVRSTASHSSKNEMSEEKRSLLREIEVKVMKFQDELESGQREKTRGLGVHEEVEKYRHKLLKQIEEKSSITVQSPSKLERKTSTDRSSSTNKHNTSVSSTTSTSASRRKERSPEASSSKKKRRSRSRSSEYRSSKHGSRRSRSRSRSPRKDKKRKH